METRGKRKQQEQETAERAAPIETRARKAARIVGQTQVTAVRPTSERKRKQTSHQEPESKPARKQSCPRERTVNSEPPNEGAASRQAIKEVPILPEAERTGKSEAPIDQPAESMDRHRRDARKELDEATREAEQDMMGEGDLFGRGLNTSALHGLLRKLGAGAGHGGFDNMMEAASGLSGGRFKAILAQLRSEDEGLQLDALNQLNELLAVSMADSLGLYPVEQLIPVLIGLLQTDHNPDIMLLAARSLTFLADVLPTCCGTIVRHGAVPALCERLLNIEYIDLAEQSLQALEKLSSEHAQACLRHGALLAVLSYLDFFQTSVQRVAVATAAHMCRGITTENTDAIESAVPILTGLLQYQDAKVVESASLALTRIAEATSRSPKHMEALCNQGLITSAIQLIAVSEGGSMTSQLAVSTYYGLVKLLCTCANGSPAVVETLFQADISNTLRKLLSSSTLFSSATTSPGSILKSSDQLNEVISLADTMLPSLPSSSFMMLKDQPSTATLTGGDDQGGQSEDIATRRKYIADHPEALQQFGSNLLSLLLHVYNGIIVQQVREKALSTIIKIIQYSPPEMLQSLLKNIAISSFVASLLASRDTAVLAVGARLSELLMLKLPEVFAKMFLKEGVFHALEQLAKEAPVQINEKKPCKRSSSRLKNKSRDKSDSKGSSPVDPAPIMAASAELKPPGYSLRQSIAVRAKKLVQQQFSKSVAGRDTDTEGMKLLKDICKDLSRPTAITELLGVLKGTDGAEVSTFEFLSSGAVQQLRQYLLGEDLDGPRRPDELLRRLHSFTDAVSNASCNTSILALIRKLQDGLAAAENLPVVATQTAMSSSALRFSSASSIQGLRSQSGDGGSLSMGLAALSQPFKLNLARAPHEEQLRNYGGHTVLIEPLASMAAMEDFLWPRVQRSSAEAAREEANKASKNLPKDDKKKGKAADPGDLKSKVSQAGGRSQDPKLPGASTVTSSQCENSGASQSRRPVSKGQPIPGASKEPQQRMTRAQASRAAQEQKIRESVQEVSDPLDNLAGTTPSDTDPLIFLQGGEGDIEGLDHEGVEDEEEMAFDEEDDEGIEEDLDEDGTLGMDRLQVHTVDLGETAPGDDSTGNTRRAEVALPHPSLAPPPASGEDGVRSLGQTYAQAAAAAADSEPGEKQPGQSCTHLRFYANGVELPGSYTIFQAVNESHRLKTGQAAVDMEAPNAPNQLRRRRLWDELHTLHYCRISNPSPEAADAGEEDCRPSQGGQAYESHALLDSPLAELLTVNLPEQLQSSSQVKDMLLLLKILEAINRLSVHLARYEEGQAGVMERKSPPIWTTAREDFISHKLTPKLAQQLKDVLAVCGGNMPQWIKQLIFDCKFLFPFDLRRRYFYCTSSGLFRALQHLQQQQTAEGLSTSSQDRDHRFSRIQRAKVRISRTRILESAMKVMEMYASNRTVLELEYFNEAGTGLGPTLEFYTLLSHELQKKGLGMWRFDDMPSEKATAIVVAKKAEGKSTVSFEAALPEKGQDGKSQPYIIASQALFPAPLHPSDASAERVLDYFKLLGRAVAKALQDNRLLDIPLSYVFYRSALRQPLDLYNIREFDSGLGKTLETLHASHQAWLNGEGHHAMMVDGAHIEDLCLTFELPGYPEYELVPGGNEIDVVASNAGDYVAAVVEATLHKGIQRQMDAFRGGFEEVLPLETLMCFHEDEIEAMLCGQGETWTVELLAEALKFDHGYTSSSTAIRYFLEILSDLDAADQRRFLRFVTGSPRLRPGGLSALQPRLTVVRKHASSTTEGQLGSSVGSQPGSLGRQASMSLVDGDLPSVMTCANYLKLPAYSTKAIMEARLLYAIREGQGSFDLS